MGLFEQHALFCHLEPRLKKRYEGLIQDHLNVSPKLAQGVKSLSHHQTAWANTQAAWRFFNNDNVGYPLLSQPLFQAARAELSAAESRYGLVAHDWCRCNYNKHHAKLDKTKMSHDKDVGYELYASLLINSETGEPIAPLGLELTNSKGTLQCDQTEVQGKQTHLDQLVNRAHLLDEMELGKKLVHIIDREADSAPHLRKMMKTKWLTRAKKDATVEYNGECVTLASLAYKIDNEIKEALNYQGQLAFLMVGELSVKLRRKSEKNIENAPEVRLVITTVLDTKGKELAKWFLLSNVEDIDAWTLATWYYWRWKIESWFKVLKGHGFQLEHWQQSSSEAIFRRLIMSSMACVLVWKLYNDNSKEALNLKTFLVKLSGRLTKRTKPITHPALLAGLWVFMQINEVLNTYSLDEMNTYRELGRQYFGLDV